MFFSVIIPTYNRAAILKDTLSSVLAQDFDDYEVIVVDDGSTDQTGEMVQALGSTKIHYFYKKNEERSVARNYGADRAQGRYLLFLDSDDRIRENQLSIIAAYIQRQHEAPKFLFAGYSIYRPDGSKLYEFRHHGTFTIRHITYGNFLGCSSVFIDRHLFLNYRFNTDPRLILFEDWELWLRVISDHPLHCIPATSILMLNHEGRSVLNYDHKQLVAKILFFKEHVYRHISGVYNYRRTFFMGVYSYASLHIAMTGQSRSAALKYLFRALQANPCFIFKRRFLGIIKHLF